MRTAVLRVLFRTLTGAASDMPAFGYSHFIVIPTSVHVLLYTYIYIITGMMSVDSYY